MCAAKTITLFEKKSITDGVIWKCRRASGFLIAAVINSRGNVRIFPLLDFIIVKFEITIVEFFRGETIC